jgi:hypothetical protein
MSTPREIVDAYLLRRGQVFWQDVLSHANAEHACSLDYQGRVLVELLQNAADRASQHIRIHLDSSHGRLYFADDGTAFSIEPPENTGKLSDFQGFQLVGILPVSPSS